MTFLMIKIQFFCSHWYLMTLDIIETNLFKEPKEIVKKSIPKYRCNLTFKSKVFDFINLFFFFLVGLHSMQG